MSTTDPQQQQMIRAAMKAIAERKPGRTKLVYDKAKRTIVAVAEGAQVPRALNITADDADMFAEVTLSAQWLKRQWEIIEREKALTTEFSCWDDGDAFTQCELGPQSGSIVVMGQVMLEGAVASLNRDQVRIILTRTEASKSLLSTFVAPDGTAYCAQASRQENGSWKPLAVVFVDVQPALDARRAALLETSVLVDSSVLCIGLGTGGAHAAIELAKCGVGRFMLVDPDRLAVGNVVRHPGGISQVGRLKVNVVRDLILDKNPDARVSTHPIAIAAESLDMIGGLVDQANIVICGTDSRPSKLLINRLCVEKSAVAVYGGAFRRAFGGQVHRVNPKQSMCYQCFVSAQPDEADDVEISSTTAAEAISYSDRPVAVEPGLSLDVVPISNMLAKLALLELLKGKQTSLSIVTRDFSAPWYLWLNRPEPGTVYASWPPLSESSDEMTIHRWYGIHIERDPGCTVCGDFVSAAAERHGLDVASLGALPSALEKA